MRLDFWNNPIVVSAFRVKYRRGAPSFVAAGYLLVLLALGAVFFHYRDVMRAVPWQRVYFLTVIGVQFALSGLIALQSTAASIQGEVTNRTLDFQRIATLSPARILVGKLLGEPAIAYLLAISSLPVALACHQLGAIDGLSLLLVYLNLATTTLMCGSLGLLHRLELPAGKATGVGTGGGVVAAVIIGMFLVPMGLGAVAGGAPPLVVTCVGLLTPVPLLHGVSTGNVWLHGMPWFGGTVPFALLTPLAQLLIVAFFFSVMVRRLHNPLNTAMSKPVAYATLVLLDLLAVGMLYQPLLEGHSPATYVAGVGLAHLLAALWLTVCVTPRRETLLSGIWRSQGRRSRRAQLWRGARTQNTAALATFCIIAFAAIASAVVVSLIAPAAAQPRRATAELALAVLIVTLLVTFSVGILYQWMVLVADRSGAAMCITVVGTLMVVPLIVGEYYDHDLARAASPVSQFVQWLRVGTRTPVVAEGLVDAGAQPLSLAPLVLAYGALLIYAWASLRRRLGAHTRAIQHRLGQMGVAPPQNRSAGARPTESPHLTAHQVLHDAHGDGRPRAPGDATPSAPVPGIDDSHRGN